MNLFLLRAKNEGIIYKLKNKGIAAQFIQDAFK